MFNPKTKRQNQMIKINPSPQTLNPQQPPTTPNNPTMPSRSNPNTPASSKRKTARTLKTKRQNTQRLTHNKITKPTPRTSQALRRAAPLSRKKARKVERQEGFARKRRMAEMGESEMRGVEEGRGGSGGKEGGNKDGQEGEGVRMEVDGVD